VRRRAPERPVGGAIRSDPGNHHQNEGGWLAYVFVWYGDNPHARPMGRRSLGPLEVPPRQRHVQDLIRHGADLLAALVGQHPEPEPDIGRQLELSSVVRRGGQAVLESAGNAKVIPGEGSRGAKGWRVPGRLRTTVHPREPGGVFDRGCLHVLNTQKWGARGKVSLTSSSSRACATSSETPPALHRLSLPLPVVEALIDLLFVPLVVELQEVTRAKILLAVAGGDDYQDAAGAAGRRRLRPRGTLQRRGAGRPDASPRRRPPADLRPARHGADRGRGPSAANPRG
jgi:hypothetical protein